MLRIAQFASSCRLIDITRALTKPIIWHHVCKPSLVPDTEFSLLLTLEQTYDSLATSLQSGGADGRAAQALDARAGDVFSDILLDGATAHKRQNCTPTGQIPL